MATTAVGGATNSNMKIFLLMLIVLYVVNAKDECSADCKCNRTTMYCRPSEGSKGSGEGLPHIPTFIKEVDSIEDYSVETLTYQDFKGRSNLKRVILKNNAISTIEANALDDLVNLVHLDLSDNQLSQLPENLYFSNTKLKVLNVANNVDLTFSLAKLPVSVKDLNAYNTSFILTQRMWDDFPQIKTYTGNICRDSSFLHEEKMDNFWTKSTTPASKKPVVENLKPEIRSNEAKSEPIPSNCVLPWALFFGMASVLSGLTVVLYVLYNKRYVTKGFQNTGREDLNPLQQEN